MIARDRGEHWNYLDYATSIVWSTTEAAWERAITHAETEFLFDSLTEYLVESNWCEGELCEISAAKPVWESDRIDICRILSITILRLTNLLDFAIMLCPRALPAEFELNVDAVDANLL